MYFCQLIRAGSLIRHGNPQKQTDTRWVMANRGVSVCVNLCAGGWVRENETALIPRYHPLGARGEIEHRLEGTALTASLNTPSNVFTHSGLRKIQTWPRCALLVQSLTQSSFGFIRSKNAKGFIFLSGVLHEQIIQMWTDKNCMHEASLMFFVFPPFSEYNLIVDLKIDVMHPFMMTVKHVFNKVQ